MDIKKRIFAATLSSLFAIMQVTPMTAVASEITGVIGKNGTYNINPTALITGTDIGYRKYKNFNLDKGDIANLIFKYGATNIETFMNLVDHQVNINGIVNSMRDGNFYNGRAVFVSPEGVVVGNSGVLNVGSFGAYTPTSKVYEDYKHNPHADLSVLQASNNNGSVTINGKVIATNNIDIHSGNIDVTKNGGMLAGTGNNILVNTNAKADELFNSIVNTRDVKHANNISKSNGNITLTSTLGTNIAGTMNNYGKGNTNITNTGKNGIKVTGYTTNQNGNTIYKNENGGITISGNLSNYKGKLTLYNNGKDGINIDKTGKISANNIEKGALDITNTGAGGINVNGNVTAIGNSNIDNTKTGTNGININGKLETVNGDSTIMNSAKNGINIKGEAINTVGKMRMNNYGENGININKTGYILADEAYIDNFGANGINIDGSTNFVIAEITNHEEGKNGTNINGYISQGIGDMHGPKGYISIENQAKNGLNINGQINAHDDVYLTNNGENGINIASTAKVNSYRENIHINNNSKGGVNVKGLVMAGKDININSKKGNITIGDESKNNYYITAGKDIKMNATDANILNYGVDKVLVAADGDLTMKVINGTIGLPVGQKACEGSGCVGIGPKEQNSRDFTKSINGNIKGKVKAQTIAQSQAAKGQDLVINYAAIDSDMNIDTIKADGRAILTVDDSGHAFNGVANGNRYNITNARPNDNTDTNIEGWGISLISNGSIGDKENKVTFIQNGADNGYNMDALVNENMYLKENSYNDSDYGADKEIATNKVCTMIAREGDLDIEFAGNTTIQDITAEGDLNVLTRGTELDIKNLGHIKDDSVIPEDYFGPRVDGQKDKGYMEEDYRDEVLPNHANITALDINKNTRPKGEDLNGYRGWANSTAKVENAVLDNGTLDITADNVYANGIEAHFNKDGFSKKENDTTKPVIGTSMIPTGHAVRPNNVNNIGRNEHERNFYYPAGDRDGIFNGIASNVDPNNGVVDATPLAIADTINITKKDDDLDIQEDIAYKRKIDDNALDNIDKRQYMRFNVSENTNPVLMENQNNGVSNLLDISRGGIAISHNGSLKVGDVIPVHLKYGDLDINANAKVVSATSSRAGAEFINIDKALANQLLYLNIMLESKNNMLAGKIY